EIADERGEDAGQPAVHGPVGERRDGQCLDVLVDAGVEGLEGLVVREVPWPGPVQYGEDETGGPTSDAARGLDVLGGRLGLVVDDHDAEPGDVDADGDHVGGEEDVDGPRG